MKPYLPSATYFPELFVAEERHFWFRSRNRAIAALVRPLLPSLPAGYRVLEVGCGNGNVLAHLEEICPKGTVFGMDLGWEPLSYARQRTKVPLVQADAGCPPFQGCFSLVGIFDVLEHVKDDVGMLRSLGRLLTPEGRLLLTVPAHGWLWSDFDDVGGHLRRYSGQGLRKTLEAAGFEVTWLSPFMSWLLPLMAIVRRRRGEHAVVERELRIHPILNPLLERVLSLEAPFIERRLRLPFGASLMAECRLGKGSV